MSGPFTGPDYQKAAKGFIGFDRNASPTFMGVIDFRLNRIGMGYNSLKDQDPHAPVSWVAEEHNFAHPFSIKKKMRDYAYNKLKDFMDLETFLNLPADMIDDIVDGIRIGNAEYEKDHPAPNELELLNKEINELTKTK